ncbi:DsbA family protein [Rhodococcus oryzae]|uniref:DsbA family protein n=1 Tax=Rhodococcus oryzae TaxID=2571143 RepID=A0ABY2RQM8_9NOCA|nr:DsbA family protein [Rhodococcus oryzae]TJZ81377.1 DsbA family protein [Rhodococcus oryzae]
MNAKNKPVTSLQPTSSRSTYILGGLAILVIAAVVIGGVIWQSNRSKPRNEGYGAVSNSAVQVAVQDDGAVRIGQPEAATTIDVFEDPMCPYCAELENTNGQELAQKVDEGKVAVRYHVLDFLNRLSASGDYSTRAVAASMCVAESGDAIAYSKFHAALFSPENQPAENGSSDHSNAELAQMAKDSGANDAAVACISDGAKVNDAAAAAQKGREALAASGAAGTPTVVVDGTMIDALGNPNWVAELN